MAKLLKDLLLTAITEDKIMFQHLYECMTGIKEKKREKCSEVTFMTKDITPNDVLNNEGKVGIVIWIDRNYVEEFNKE